MIRDKLWIQVVSPGVESSGVDSLPTSTEWPAKNKRCLFGLTGRDNRWKKSKEEVDF